MQYAALCSESADPSTARCHAHVLTTSAAKPGRDALKKLFRPDASAFHARAASFHHVALLDESEPTNATASDGPTNATTIDFPSNATNATTTGGRRMLRGGAAGSARALLGLPSGFSPAQLQQAYMGSSRPTACQPIAIVDAFASSHAQSDLNVYRSTFGLGAMTIQQFDQNGNALRFPGAVQQDDGWTGEQMLVGGRVGGWAGQRVGGTMGAEWVYNQFGSGTSAAKAPA
jgi:hypothetical protein